MGGRVLTLASLTPGHDSRYFITLENIDDADDLVDGGLLVMFVVWSIRYGDGMGCGFLWRVYVVVYSKPNNPIITLPSRQSDQMQRLFINELIKRR